MPKGAEIREIDGGIWVRVEISGDPVAITLWTDEEKREALKMAYDRGYTDAMSGADRNKHHH